MRRPDPAAPRAAHRAEAMPRPKQCSANMRTSHADLAHGQ